MAKLTLDPIDIKKQPKFYIFASKLHWQPHQALGFLCAFWGEVINTEANEFGDISDWTPDYLASRIGIACDPNRLWEALMHGYIESKPNDRFLVREWIDIAGRYLEDKWRQRSGGQEKLDEMWNCYGRIRPRRYRENATHSTPMSTGGISEESQRDLGEASDLRKSAEKRTIQGGKIDTPTPYSVSPSPSEDLKASHNPPTPLSTTKGEPGLSERRGTKTLPTIRMLSERFSRRLDEMKGEKVTFDFFEWNESLKQLVIGYNYPPTEVERRYESFLISSEPFIKRNLNNARVFYNLFSELKDGPVTANQVNHGRQRTGFDDGAATVPYQDPEL